MPKGKGKKKGAESAAPAVQEPPKLYMFGLDVGSTAQGVFQVVDGQVTPISPAAVKGHFFVGDCTPEGKRVGRGLECFPNGTVFDGEFDEEKRNGHGTITFPDGSKYEGNFHHGLFHGQGILRTASACFRGEWESGYLNGTATVEEKSGLHCQGEFRDGQRNGMCTVTYPSGSRYDGHWLNDKKHGQGTQTWPNGMTFTGEWHSGQQHGAGTLRLPSGRVIAGTWANGKLVTDDMRPSTAQ